jgi:hypothetical protein
MPSKIAGNLRRVGGPHRLEEGVKLLKRCLRDSGSEIGVLRPSRMQIESIRDRQSEDEGNGILGQHSDGSGLDLEGEHGT